MPTAMPVAPLTSRFGNAAGKTVGSVRVSSYVGHQRRAEMGHARFGVPHCRWWIAFNGSKISLAVDQRFAHCPRLRHVDKRRVNHRFTMRVIITAGIAADLCAFTMLPPREKR